jgi:hypothetical protein
MEALNLNSQAYTNGEIEKLLHLSKPYNGNDIAAAKKRLIQQFTTTANLGNEKQRELINFIDSIAIRIKNDIDMDIQNVHSVIQAGSNFIIENPDRLIGKTAKIENGRMTLESKSAPPGYLNPLNVRTITQAISIDSRFRPNYYGTKSTNYDIVLPAIQKNVVSMRVASIELPTTYYAVSACNENSTCLVLESTNTTGWLLTLPDGNYEQSWANNSKASFIEKAMNTTIAQAKAVTLDKHGRATLVTNGATLKATDLTFSLDRISGKAFFTAVPAGIFATKGFTMCFNVDVNGNLTQDANLQMRLGWQLGFRNAQYLNTKAPLKCVSEGICLVCGPRYGFISIDDYQKNTGPAYMVAYASSILQDNIITRINLAELQADVGVYQSSSDPGLSTQLNRTREYFGPVDIQRLHISIYDEFGRVIDLNYMDWSLTLAFELLYN